MSKRGDDIIQEVRNLLDLPVEQKIISIKSINTAGRMREDYGDMQELCLSIEQKGLIHPITVMKYEKKLDGKYEYYLLAGGRRLRAFEQLKLEEIPARIYPDGLNGYEIRAIELEENIRRKEMSVAEELKAKKQLMELWEGMYGKKTSTAKDAEGVSIRDAAGRLGISKSKMAEDLDHAKWLEDVPELSKLSSRQDMRKAIKKAKKKAAVKKKLDEFEQEVGGKEKKEMLELMERSYRVGDFLSSVGSIPKETIDFIDLDIDYPVDIDEESPQHQGVQMDKKFGDYKVVDKKIFPEYMQETLRACHRVMAKDSWIIIWFGWEYFSQIQQWAKAVGFRTSWYTGKWYKGGGYGHTRNPYTYLNHTIEPFFYFRKGMADISIPRSDVFEYPPVAPSDRVHPYEKPVPLMRDILNTFINPGSRILVPYAGSGNTLIAGFELKCHGLGFEKSEAYKEGYVLKLRINNALDV